MINIREIAEEYRLGHWAQVIQEIISSGQSIKVYCRQISISTNTYHYWQKKLREAAIRELNVSSEVPDNKTLVPSGWTKCQPVSDTASTTHTYLYIQNSTKSNKYVIMIPISLLEDYYEQPYNTDQFLPGLL